MKGLPEVASSRCRLSGCAVAMGATHDKTNQKNRARPSIIQDRLWQPLPGAVTQFLLFADRHAQCWYPLSIYLGCHSCLERKCIFSVDIKSDRDVHDLWRTGRARESKKKANITTAVNYAGLVEIDCGFGHAFPLARGQQGGFLHCLFLTHFVPDPPPSPPPFSRLIISSPPPLRPLLSASPLRR